MISIKEMYDLNHQVESSSQFANKQLEVTVVGQPSLIIRNKKWSFKAFQNVAHSSVIFSAIGLFEHAPFFRSFKMTYKLLGFIAILRIVVNDANVIHRLQNIMLSTIARDSLELILDQQAHFQTRLETQFGCTCSGYNQDFSNQTFPLKVIIFQVLDLKCRT